MTPEGLPRPADRIYCCRSLRLDQVAVVGFDLDYTLARYEQPEMEQLAVAATLRRLVERGLPAASWRSSRAPTASPRGGCSSTSTGATC